MVEVKKIKEEAKLPYETSSNLPDSERERNHKLETSRSPPPLMTNVELQVRSATFNIYRVIQLGWI